MTLLEAAQLAAVICSPFAAAAGAYAAVSVRLRWHWFEIQRAHARIDQIEGKGVHHGALA